MAFSRGTRSLGYPWAPASWKIGYYVKWRAPAAWIGTTRIPVDYQMIDICFPHYVAMRDIC